MSRTLLRGMAFAALALGFGAWASEDAEAPWLSWHSQLHASHPLVGKIWSSRESRFVTPQVLADELSTSRFVLIGEIHDNVDHHRLQAWLIGEIGQRRKPRVVMEMIRHDQSALLDAYLAGSDGSAAGLGSVLDWERSGWPDWRLYQPIAEAALGAGLRLAAGSPSGASTKTISDGGLETLGPEERERLALDGDLSPDLQEALHRELEASHCDLLPAGTVGPFADVQRYRDATMARSLVGGDHDGAILIAGNGHVRSDRGVPWYLAQIDPGASVSSIMLLEVPEPGATLTDLVVSHPAGETAADYFWFTPEAVREDPCELLRRRIER